MPKLKWKSWEILKRELNVTAASTGWRWATPFSPASFAGMQVAMQAWASAGTIVSARSAWFRQWELLNDQAIQALSCTPTFLQLLIQHGDPPENPWRPEQITLGGEPLRANNEPLFRCAFPRTRFTTIYAASEFGVIAKTERIDGWFEVASLEKRFPVWRIEQQELQLFISGDWRKTGDLIERKNGLFAIKGRIDSVANVAGTKVSLPEVTWAAHQVDGVRRATAFAVTSSVCGELVGLRFTPEQNAPPEDVKRRLEGYLRKALPREAWPRVWEVGEIEMGPNAKQVLYTALSRRPS